MSGELLSLISDYVTLIGQRKCHLDLRQSPSIIGVTPKEGEPE